MKIRTYEATVTATAQQDEIRISCTSQCRHLTEQDARQCADRTLLLHPALATFAPAVTVECR